MTLKYVCDYCKLEMEEPVWELYQAKYRALGPVKHYCKQCGEKIGKLGV